MATPSTVATWTLNGSTTEFDVPFDYLSRTFVKVTLIGATSTVLTLGTDYQFITPTRIQTFAAYGPPGYSLIEIRRETSTTERLVEFHDASILTASDMNTADLQVLHVAEEARNAATETIGVNNDGDLDARGRRIVNVAAPRTGTADAVNMAFYESDINGANVARVAAEAARDKANEWAVKPTPVEVGKESAKTYAERAGSSEATASAASSAAVAARDQAVPAAATATEKAAEAVASASVATTKAAEAEASAAAAATFEPSKFVPQTSPTGHATLPTSSGASGQTAGLRYNNVKNRVEFWNGTAWAGLGGGGSLFDYYWHNGARSEITGGRIACDGQQLTQLMYPEAYAAVIAGKQHKVTESVWQADTTKRNCWSEGGPGWVRVPDLNGVQAGTGKPFYLRGSPTGLNGTSVLDALQQHGHRVAGSNINQGNTTGYHIAIVYTPNASGDKTGMNNYGTVVYRDDFVTDVVNGRTADETRVKTAYGVWTVTVATEAVNSGSVDVLELATKVNNLETGKLDADKNINRSVLTAAAGTSLSFSVPTLAKRVTVVLHKVALSGAADLLVQCGTSVGFETTGYVSTANNTANPNAVNGANSTAGFINRASSPANVQSGTFIIEKLSDTELTYTSTMRNNTTNVSIGAGDKVLAGPMTGVRLTTTGSDTFTSGKVVVSWE